jgi:hypothetical protein
MIRAYECTVVGTDWHTVIHATSAGKAKYRYLRAVRDAWDTVTFKDVRCRSLGAPRDTEKFLHTAKYRGIDLHIGDRVMVGGSSGYVVDSDSSANFTVEFTEGRFKGCVLSVHPSEMRRAS